MQFVTPFNSYRRCYGKSIISYQNNFTGIYTGMIAKVILGDISDLGNAVGA
jgi:hypothetical protein